MKFNKLTKILTSLLNVHASLTSQGVSEKRSSDLLSSIRPDSMHSQDGGGQRRGATERELAAPELSEFKEYKRSSII